MMIEERKMAWLPQVKVEALTLQLRESNSILQIAQKQAMTSTSARN